MGLIYSEKPPPLNQQKTAHTAEFQGNKSKVISVNEGMKILRAFTFALLMAFTVAPLRAAESTSVAYKPAAKTNEIQTISYEWKDEKRDREVPVKIYYPKTGKGPFPVIIFSHGLGGSRENYKYLGEYWAGHGYISIHLQHRGSDDAVWRDVAPEDRMRALKAATMNVQNILNRPKDVTFAVDQLEKLDQQDGPLKGKFDLNRLGMAGHSFGAFTTLVVAGETLGDRSFVDSRVKAAIPMSAPAPRLKSQYDAAFAKVKIPCFHMTGTKDNSPIGDTKAEERRVPFDHIHGVDQFLVTYEGGDHMIFSGRPRRTGDASKDPIFHELICQSSLAFWNAYLKGDAQAKSWLADKGFETVLGANGKLESKLKGR
jgi:predicted dienelactone hydrolase